MLSCLRAKFIKILFFSFALDITSLFKQVHITQGSRVADHCAVYALSDPKEDHFQGTCDHAHDQSCSSSPLVKGLILFSRASRLQ